MTKRNPFKNYGNLWEPVGGSIIYGESSLEGAIREIEEEIGIVVSKLSAKLIKTQRRDEENDFIDLRPIYEDIQLSRNIDSLLIVSLMISLVSYVTKLNKSIFIYAGMIIKVPGSYFCTKRKV